MMIENKDFVHWQDVMNDRRVAVARCRDRQSKVCHTSTSRPRRSRGWTKVSVPATFAIFSSAASARETAARVACGAIAKQLLSSFGIDIKSHVIRLGPVQAVPLWRDWDEIASIPDDSPLRCADETAQKEMIKAIDEAKKEGDTLGGIYEVVARGVPVGLGSHTSWEDKLDGRIARAIMSIHATKAVEIGEGIANAGRLGSQVHDEIFLGQSEVLSLESEAGSESSDSGLQTPDSRLASGFRRPTNRAGGLEGGITNGEEIRVRGHMKPLSTLRKALRSVDIETKLSSDAAFERSDITAVPAAGVIGEAMLAFVLADAMRQKFGGDSIDEMRRNFDGYLASIADY